MLGWQIIQFVAAGSCTAAVTAAFKGYITQRRDEIQSREELIQDMGQRPVRGAVIPIIGPPDPAKLMPSHVYRHYRCLWKIIELERDIYGKIVSQFVVRDFNAYRDKWLPGWREWDKQSKRPFPPPPPASGGVATPRRPKPPLPPNPPRNTAEKMLSELLEAWRKEGGEQTARVLPLPPVEFEYDPERKALVNKTGITVGMQGESEYYHVDARIDCECYYCTRNREAKLR